MKSNYFFEKVLTLTLAAILCGCGGGGGGGGGGVSLASIGGTVAMGAPLENASVTIKDSRGQLVGTTTTDASGKYSLSFDPNNFVAPFVIQADGLSGDAGISLTSVATTTGQANVTQLTNAISASLSNSGNPLDLSSNTSGQTNLSASSIAQAESAYRAALSGVMSAMGVSGSLISTNFSVAMDKLLDNVSATVQPSGQVILGTTAGKVGNDLAANSTASAAYSSLVIQAGALPSANSASSLVVPDSSTTLTIGDLETLRSRLEKCFKTTSTADRGTPQSPSIDCADSKFVATSDLTQANAFKHSSFKWNSQDYNGTTHVSSYWAGIFGYMLTQSKYDGAKFLTPKIIRPLDSDGTTWAVKFPILFADGTVDQLGDAIRSPFIVVKKIAGLSTVSDNGFRFVGDQRDYQSSAIPVVQKIMNQVTGDYRYETGVNLYVGNFYSSTDGRNLKPVAAKITGKGLPVGGVYVAQKYNGSCGTYLPITSAGAISQTISGDWSTVNTTYPCAGVFVLSFANSNNYATFTDNARFLKWLGNDGKKIGESVGNSSGTLTGLSTSVGNYLSDSDIGSIEEGEPYKFEIRLSDGSTVSFVNRLAIRPLTASETLAFSYYPSFANSTKSDLLTYVGATSASINFGLSAGNVHPWSAAIYWGVGANGGTNSVIMPYASSSALIPCTGAASNSCATSSNWVQGSAGLFQVRSRTSDGLDVYSQIRNGF